MGRPRLDDAKRVHIPLKVSEQMAKHIDAARGIASRAQWVRQVIDAALSSAGEPEPPVRPARAPAPPVPAKPARPAAAAAGPQGAHAGHYVCPAWGTAKTGRYRCETCRAWLSGPEAVLPVKIRNFGRG